MIGTHVVQACERRELILFYPPRTPTIHALRSLDQDIGFTHPENVYTVAGRIVQFHPFTTVTLRGCSNTSGRLETGNYKTSGLHNGRLGKSMSTTGAMRVSCRESQSVRRASVWHDTNRIDES